MVLEGGRDHCRWMVVEPVVSARTLEGAPVGTAGQAKENTGAHHIVGNTIQMYFHTISKVRTQYTHTHPQVGHQSSYLYSEQFIMIRLYVYHVHMSFWHIPLMHPSQIYKSECTLQPI